MHVAEVTKDPLTNRVIRRIQELILGGEVVPGEYLPSQQDLAAQFGVGLSTIREAVKALSLIGLLEAYPGRGTLVLPDAVRILTSDAAMKANLGAVEAEQILEARMVIEVALTRMAAERATAQDIADIEDAFAEMKATIDDDAAFPAADLRFHLALARASKNEVLAQTYYLIHSLLEQAIQAADALPGGKDRALANHVAILEGIKAHVPARAQQAAERQISEVTEFLRAAPPKTNG